MNLNGLKKKTNIKFFKWFYIQKFQSYIVYFFKTGNDNIHILTSSGKYELRIDLGDWTGNKWYAIYKSFTVGNEATKYILTVGGYSGNASKFIYVENK